MADPAVVTRSLSVNGAELAVHDTGGEGPPLVLAGGLGGPFCGWRHQLDYLSDRYRMVGWDYRGLFGSTIPEHESPSYSVSEHADDFENVLSACGIARAPFIGWSMGVQVVLELYERHPEMVSHLVLINGTWGRPLETLPIPVLRQLCRAYWRAPAVCHKPAAGSCGARRSGRKPCSGSSVWASSAAPWTKSCFARSPRSLATSTSRCT